MNTSVSIEDTPVQAQSEPRQFFKSSTVQLLYTLIAYKAFILWFVLASSQLLPNAFSLDGYNANFHWPKDKKLGLKERYMTWDGEHYLYLSGKGYEAGSPSAAFYPLWPGVISLSGKLLGGPNLIAALALSNIFSLAAWLLFHKLVVVEFGNEVADWATIFLIVYPGSLFFQFPYTESLFLLLAMVFFWGIARGNNSWIALSGFLLPITRSVGLLCALPLVVNIWLRKKHWRDYAPLCAIGVGWCTYLVVMRLLTGNMFEGFAAQKHYLVSGSISKLLDLPGFVNAFFTSLQLHGFVNSAFDRLFFVGVVAALFPIYRLNKTYFAYSVAVGLIPAILNSFMSYTRYVSVVFPLFIVAAQFFGAPERKYWRYVTVAILFAIQVLFLLRHINFCWAG